MQISAIKLNNVMQDNAHLPITVLMPAYNAQDYIREAIESVLAQTFTDFEFIIVNDGSTDSTEEIIRSYKDERIKLINQPNAGVIGALNTGLQYAKGKYTARFDADDVCYPQRLKVQYEFMEAHPEYVLTGSAADFIDMEGNYLFEWQPSAYEHEDLQRIIYQISPFDHPTIMYRTDVAKDLGGYPSGAIHFEDHVYWTLFFKKGKLCNLKEPLIKHRYNPQSVTIDEKWRGPLFMEIKYRSIKQGYTTPEDAAQLKALLKGQDLKKFKDAAYYGMMGKKYLWNRYDPKKARKNLAKAISIMPGKLEPYMLYVFSFFPEKMIKAIYNKKKG
jgi:glycosyltransferase involved in cell wall biosynthesis